MQDSLKWPDYLIMVGFLVISLSIGVYHSLTGGRQKTTTEFFLADRNLKVLPTAISLCVSFQSAILILGMPAELYGYGVQYLLLGPFCFLVNAVAVREIFVPWFYPLRLVSVNEYVFLRFQSNSVKMLASILQILVSIIYMGSAMYAPSAALESVTNFPITLSVPLMSTVCVIYTALGGMRAVIWTDVFQCITMFGGMLAIIIKGFIVVGGVGNAFHYANSEGRLNWADFDPDPTVRHTFWGIMIGQSVSWLPAYGTSQAAFQRYSATESLSKAKMTIVFGALANILSDILAASAALVVFAYFAMMQCDPIAGKEIHNENQILPHFVMKIFGGTPGFVGLFLATLYGGALSSVSSSLSGSAANFWEDIAKQHFSNLSEAKKALINRLLVVVFGILATTVSFLVMVLPGPITQISMALCNSVIGSIFGIFLLGGLSRHGNWKGALVGGLASLITIFWISIGSMNVPNKYPSFPPISVDGCPVEGNFTSDIASTTERSSVFTTAEPRNSNIYEMKWTPDHSGINRFYCLSYTWYTLLAMIITLIVGYATSFTFRDKALEDAVEDRFLIKFRTCDSCKTSVEDDEEKSGLEKQNTDQSNGEVKLSHSKTFPDRESTSF